MLIPVTAENAAERTAEIEKVRLSLVKQKEEVEALKKKADAAEKKAALERELAEFRQAEIQSVAEFQKKTKSRRPDGLNGREIFTQVEAATAARTGVAQVAAALANSQASLVNPPGENRAPP